MAMGNSESSKEDVSFFEMDTQGVKYQGYSSMIRFFPKFLFVICKGLKGLTIKETAYFKQLL
jgi:hypothetical protein